LPVGAEVRPEGVHFRVWAPKRACVEVVFADTGGEWPLAVPLTAEDGGYFSGLVEDAGAGALYRFRLDGGDAFPDPASRFQPEGPHGPSRVVDPDAYAWQDRGWRGVRPAGMVLYELHIGTFTREGTWAAAARELAELARLGITCIEVMPVAEFPGAFGWGYDGVDLFAPSHLYGAPDDFRRFVDRAHSAGLGVILDVVYNHFGPDGNYLKQFSESYFTDRYTNDWGEAINFEDDVHAVRDFFVANARHWIAEYHLDGLRLDATQDVKDASPEHILAAIGRAARAEGAAAGRGIYLVAENEPQHTRLVAPPERGGYGLDALWNDDFHHTAVVALTGRSEAYYSDYCGTPQELISAVKYGYLYQGQRYSWQEQRRGTPGLHLPRTAFVSFLQNHDQVANSARGERVHTQTSPAVYRAMTALLLLAPSTPMLFMGQEFCASTPFLYFADHTPELARAVRDGRREFLAQFPSLTAPEIADAIPDPSDRATFERCKLDFAERESHATGYRLHEDLLRLRREDPVFRAHAAGEIAGGTAGGTAAGLDGAVLGQNVFLLRFFAPSAYESREDRLLLINFGHDLRLVPAPEPLLAPPADRRWEVLWSSESPRYGGGGAPPAEDETGGWIIPGHAATVLRPVPREGEGREA
jgi:maltooligosyltrehalose trehalohydrolase